MENYVAFTWRSIDLRSIYQVFFEVSSIISLVAKATLFWRRVVFNVVEEFFFVEVAKARNALGSINDKFIGPLMIKGIFH